jgi:hypothetical protein
VIDNTSNLARFNDERLFVEFILTRQFPRGPIWKASLIDPIVRGLHSDWLYRALEAGTNGVVDFKLDEAGDSPCSRVRIRNFRNAHFDGKWYRVRVEENFEVTVEK